MKRVIRASRYSDKTDHYKHYLKFYGSLLVDACNIENDLDFEDLAGKLGVSGKYIKTQKDAIKYVVERIDDAASEYLLSSNAESKYPQVKEDILAYLEGQGYDMSLTYAPNGYDEAHVLVSEDKVTFDDLKQAASSVARAYGIKPDTGIIGGSWTAYGFKLDGVKFKIGFIGDDGSLLIGF